MSGLNQENPHGQTSDRWRTANTSVRRSSCFRRPPTTARRLRAGGSGAETVCYVAAHPTPPSMVLATPTGQPLARELIKTPRVIFPAPRGSGGSNPRRPYEPRRLAADIAALLDAAGAQRAIV